ncbi:RICIN domain-containing protein [Streptomyces xiamenensis]
MTLWTSLEPASATVAPGDSTRVRLRLRNTGDVVDEYRFEPVGDVAPWTTVEPQTLRLYPGTTGAVELTFAPPRTPDATAGPTPFAVRITPTEHPEAVTVPEGNVTVLPFSEVRAELVPPTVKGRFRGRPRLAVDNLGNTPLTASLSGSDNGDQLSYDLHPSNVRIEPGRAAFVKATLRPKEIRWFGGKEERPYTLAVQRSGKEPLPVEGTFLQRGFLPGWLAAFLGAAVALALAFAMLWYTHDPKVKSLATELANEVSEPIDPPPASAEPPPPPPEPDPEPDPEPEIEEEEEESGGEEEGAGGGGEEEEEPLMENLVLWNSSTWRCADIPGAKPELDYKVEQHECKTDQQSQRWNLEVRLPDGGPAGTPLFQIRNVWADYCMDLPGQRGHEAGTVLTQYRCVTNTDDNQLWWLDKQDNGYWIRNFKSNNLCLVVDGLDATRVDHPLTLGDCASSDHAQWTILDIENDIVL